MTATASSLLLLPHSFANLSLNVLHQFPEQLSTAKASRQYLPKPVLDRAKQMAEMIVTYCKTSELSSMTPWTDKTGDSYVPLKESGRFEAIAGRF